MVSGWAGSLTRQEPARVCEEAVFSSSEDQIRASHGKIAVAGRFIVSSQLTGISRRPVLSEIGSPHRYSLIRSWAGQAAEGLFAVLFPSDCRICKIPLVKISRLPVCQPCIDEMVPLAGKTCTVCGERVLALHVSYTEDGTLLCPLCSQAAPPFERAVAYGSYQDGLRELIHLLKYGGVRPAANVLGRMLAEAMAMIEVGLSQLSLAQAGLLLARPEQKIAVIPVPLHKTRLRQRGFNQAELIARVALKLHDAQRPATPGNFFLLHDVLQRRRETQSQIGLTSQQRRANMRGAFAVKCPEKVTGREVLLVDDVYTTGTTASECARVLRRAGASRVWVATVARTLKLASNYGTDDAEKIVEERMAEVSSGLAKVSVES